MSHSVISIHAPTRGATYYRCHHLQPSQFQSTLPRGERHKPIEYETDNLIISIHAPTRGATVHIMPPSADFIISIHAPTRGATVKIILWVSTSTFQSTLPRGERRSCCNKVTVILDFNPRSHEGSDVMWLLLAQRQNVFQSTLPRGERHIKTYFCNEMYYFNPRSHEGSDYNWPLLP